jgi:hypothetical protein
MAVITEVPLQTAWFETALTAGVGFTVNENVNGAPPQPKASGCTVIKPV